MKMNMEAKCNVMHASKDAKGLARAFAGTEVIVMTMAPGVSCLDDREKKALLNILESSMNHLLHYVDRHPNDGLGFEIKRYNMALMKLMTPNIDEMICDCEHSCANDNME